MIYDDGTGFDYPLFEKDDQCYFDTGDTLTLKQKGKGVIKILNKKDLGKDFEKELMKNGWKSVNFDED